MTRRVSVCLALVLAANSAHAEPPITALAFAPDGLHVACGSQRGIEVRSWPSLDVVRRIETVLPHVHDLVFSPDGTHLVAAGGAPSEFGGYELFSWPDGEPLLEGLDHTDVAYAASWSADGSYVATAAGDEQVALWDAARGTRRHELTGHSRRVLAVALVPNTELIVSSGVDQSLRVWDRASGNLVRVLDNHTDEVRDLALRPNDHDLPMVASASADRTVRFWQPTIGRMVRFARLPAEPLALAWTATGDRLAIACTDGHLRVIDPQTLETSLDEPAIDGWAYEVAVAPDNAAAVVAGTDGQICRILLGNRE
jgi:WD40 repeat protein